MKKNTKITIGALVVVAAIAYLFISGFSGNMSVHANLSDLISNSQEYDGKFIQTEGKLVANSIDWNTNKVELRFTISDGKSEMPVLWKDVKPDNFTGDVIVMVGGKYTAGKEFVADTLTTKCPSKYESEKKQIK